MRHSDRDQHEEYARQKSLESYLIEQKQKEASDSQNKKGEKEKNDINKTKLQD